jgi:hypothetical protein
MPLIFQCRLFGDDPVAEPRSAAGGRSSNIIIIIISVRRQPESCPFRFGVVSLGPVYGWHPLSPSTAVSSRGGRIISVRPEPQVATSANRRPGGASGSLCAGRSADRARRVGARLTRTRGESARVW